jgi:hypothetical protein
MAKLATDVSMSTSARAGFPKMVCVKVVHGATPRATAKDATTSPGSWNKISHILSL